MGAARGEQGRLVGEVAVNSGTPHAGTLSHRADRGARWPDAAVQLDRALGDAQPRLLLELGATPLAVDTFLVLIGHQRSINLDTEAASLVQIPAILLSAERIR